MNRIKIPAWMIFLISSFCLSNPGSTSQRPWKRCRCQDASAVARGTAETLKTGEKCHRNNDKSKEMMGPGRNV